MSIVAIDLWDVRVWVAYECQWVALPLAIVPRVQIISYLRRYISKNNIHTFVVGLPYDLYGKKTKQLEKTQRFIEKLKKNFPDIDIVWHDERYSTYLAWELTNKQKDDIAALIILQSYIDSLGFL